LRTIGVIGAGSWGTALANLLSNKGMRVRVWDTDSDLLAYIAKNGENKKYLPGVKLHKAIEVTKDAAAALADAEFCLMAVPAQHFRAALTAAAGHIARGAILVNVAKGIEQGTLALISRVAAEVLPEHEYAILSGPSHAEEVGVGMPTTVCTASARLYAAQTVQDLFMTERFRVYTNNDVTGVELGGALKNIIALGAGISDGMGFGDNTKAALMTRGIAEMARLGVRMGAQRETFFGLSGVGDLIVTCTSMHSRNRRCGIMIGEGMDPKEAVARVGMVVEGITTAAAAAGLAERLGVEMPITENICRVVKGETEAKDALTLLMTRDKKHEQEELA
jgi:glycerol-3-phosphate dehydrogenase (NAD(P)+)